ncbi:hypothetical protein CKA32_005728 [Geitlerinema sp. FC II]|nr:hypothetical protein CKA32_005728 [Geitlerinema sp. FC II]
MGDWEIGRLGDWEIGRGGEIVNYPLIIPSPHHCFTASTRRE